MTRDVVCTVVNNLSGSLTLNSTDIDNGGGDGKFTQGPISTISPNNGSGQQVFQAQKRTGALLGTTGYVAYNLPNSGGLLVLMWSNPYTQAGSGSTNNSWFYAGIMPDPNNPSYPTNYYVSYVGGFTINPENPTNEDVMSPIVTICQPGGPC